MADTLATVAAGRAAVVARVRRATRLDGLSLDTAPDVLVLLEPTLEAFERQAALAFGREPTDAWSKLAARSCAIRNGPG